MPPRSAIAAPSIPPGARLLHHRWLLILAAWAVPALLAALETYAFWRMSGRPYPFWRAVATQSPAWFVYALLTPAVFALGRRLPPQRPRLGRHLVLHLVTALVIGAGYASAATAASRAFAPSRAFAQAPRTMPFAQTALNWFLSSLPLTMLAYFGILGVGAALDYLGEARRREMDAARLSAQLAEARLGALRMQLHPHFLFNTLNAITVLARDRDHAAVVRMLGLLSELLREVLRTDHAHQVSLAEELAFARRYLEIELVRFADRLRVREVVDDAALAMDVPVFVLQPLIENALRHGIAARADGGTVTIGARVVDDALELRVHDDGVGLPAGWAGADDYGIGLSNTAARLGELYGVAGALSVAPAPGGGTLATVRLPRRVATDPAPTGERRTSRLALAAHGH